MIGDDVPDESALASAVRNGGALSLTAQEQEKQLKAASRSMRCTSTTPQAFAETATRYGCAGLPNTFEYDLGPRGIVPAAATAFGSKPFLTFAFLVRKS